jgi:hypothetical protein
VKWLLIRVLFALGSAFVDEELPTRWSCHRPTTFRTTPFPRSRLKPMHQFRDNMQHRGLAWRQAVACHVEMRPLSWLERRKQVVGCASSSYGLVVPDSNDTTPQVQPISYSRLLIDLAPNHAASHETGVTGLAQVSRCGGCTSGRLGD